MSNILFNANNGFVIYNFRKELIVSLIEDGHNIFCSFSGESYTKELQELGCSCIDIKHNFNSYNLLKDFLLIRKYKNIMNENSIDIMLNFTIKCNIFGGFTSRFYNKNAINNITGLGRTFASNGILNKVIRLLYKFSHKSVKHILFQNKDDMELFLENKIIKKSNSYSLINGSGVNLDLFKTKKDITFVKSPLKVLFVGRILKEKGYEVFHQVAEKFKDNNSDKLRFYSVGKWNESSNISASLLESECVKYLGTSKDMVTLMDDYDVVCLPSLYREGVPRSLIEACSMSKIIVTTDNVGCREAVNNKNGFLVKIDDVEDLFLKLQELSEIDTKSIESMRRQSRELAVEKFDVNVIINKYKMEISNILRGKK